MATDEQNLANIPVFYSNSLRLGLSFSDIKLFFGEAIPPTAPDSMAAGEVSPIQTAKHVDRICIVLSPDIVPALVDGLLRAVQAYEAQFGPLRKMPHVPAAQIPQALQPPADAAKKT